MAQRIFTNEIVKTTTKVHKRKPQYETIRLVRGNTRTLQTANKSGNHIKTPPPAQPTPQPPHTHPRTHPTHLILLARVDKYAKRYIDQHKCKKKLIGYIDYITKRTRKKENALLVGKSVKPGYHW